MITAIENAVTVGPRLRRYLREEAAQNTDKRLSELEGQVAVLERALMLLLKDCGESGRGGMSVCKIPLNNCSSKVVQLS